MGDEKNLGPELLDAAATVFLTATGTTFFTGAGAATFLAGAAATNFLAGAAAGLAAGCTEESFDRSVRMCVRG